MVGGVEVDILDTVEKGSHSGVVTSACIVEHFIDGLRFFTQCRQGVPGEHHARFDRVRNDFVGAAFEQPFEMAIVTCPDNHRDAMVEGPCRQRNMLAGLDLGKRNDQHACSGDAGQAQNFGFTAVSQEHRLAGFARFGDDVGFYLDCDKGNIDPAQKLGEILCGTPESTEDHMPVEMLAGCGDIAFVLTQVSR